MLKKKKKNLPWWHGLFLPQIKEILTGYFSLQKFPGAKMSGLV